MENNFKEFDNSDEILKSFHSVMQKEGSKLDILSGKEGIHQQTSSHQIDILRLEHETSSDGNEENDLLKSQSSITKLETHASRKETTSGRHQSIVFSGPATLPYVHQLEYEYRPPSYGSGSEASQVSPTPFVEAFKIFQDLGAKKYLQLSKSRPKSACNVSVESKEKLRHKVAQLQLDNECLLDKIFDLENDAIELECNLDLWLERYAKIWPLKNQEELQLLVAERELTKRYQDKHTNILDKKRKSATNDLPKLEPKQFFKDKLVPRPPNGKPTFNRRKHRVSANAFGKLTRYLRPIVDKPQRPTSPVKLENCDKRTDVSLVRKDIVLEEMFDLRQFDTGKDLQKAKIPMFKSSSQSGIPILKQKSKINITAAFNSSSSFFANPSYNQHEATGAINMEPIKHTKQIGADHKLLFKRSQMNKAFTFPKLDLKEQLSTEKFASESCKFVSRPPTGKRINASKQQVGSLLNHVYPPIELLRKPTKLSVVRPPTKLSSVQTKLPVLRPPTKLPVLRPPTKLPLLRSRYRNSMVSHQHQ